MKPTAPIPAKMAVEGSGTALVEAVTFIWNGPSVLGKTRPAKKKNSPATPVPPLPGADAQKLTVGMFGFASLSSIQYRAFAARLKEATGKLITPGAPPNAFKMLSSVTVPIVVKTVPGFVILSLKSETLKDRGGPGGFEPKYSTRTRSCTSVGKTLVALVENESASGPPNDAATPRVPAVV
jgi:hypothetical protein